MQIFNPDSKFSQFIYSVMDYIKLGLVFLLFSIPGITAGAAAAAVMTVGMRIERKEAPYIFRPFWQAFKDNLKQGTGLTLLFMAVFGFLAADWYMLGRIEPSGLTRVLSAFIFLLALLAGCLALWAFPTLARFDLRNRQILHNAFIHCFSRFPQTLLALAAAVGGFVLVSLVPQTLPLVTLFVPAFVVWYMSRTCVRRFRKFDGTAGEAESAAAAEAQAAEALAAHASRKAESLQLN